MKNKKKGGLGTGNELTDKVLATMEKHKEVRMCIMQREIVVPTNHITSTF